MLYSAGSRPDSTKGLSVTRTNVEEVVEMLGGAENVIIVSGSWAHVMTTGSS